MQIAFAKLLAFSFLLSRRKSMFVCSRSLYLKMFIPRNGNRLVSEYVAHVDLLHNQLTRKGKSLHICHYVTPIKPRSHMPSGAFSYVRNSLHSCIYLSFPPMLYHRFHWYVTLQNKKPVETFPKFLSVLCVSIYHTSE